MITENNIKALRKVIALLNNIAEDITIKKGKEVYRSKGTTSIVDVSFSKGCATSFIDTANELNEILMAQGFQDLTGQVIKRVMTLIADVESNLLKLVVMAGQVDRAVGIEHSTDDLRKKSNREKKSNVGEGPQIHADKLEDVVSDQVDVDDLLSGLGF